MKKYNLAGAMVNGFYAPNISASGLKDYDTQTVKKVFKEDRLLAGGAVQGPMLEANHDSLSYLSDHDIDAIITYLRTVKSALPPMPSTSGGVPGQGTYETYCSSCHATGAGGAPIFGDKATWDSRIKDQGEDTLYHNAIYGYNAMPAKGMCSTCTDDEIKQAVDYMIAGGGPGTKVNVITPMVPPKPVSIAQGKHIYQTNCAICHGPGHKNAPIIGDKAAWSAIAKQGFYKTYLNTIHGIGGHPKMGNCHNCNGGDVKAAVKYMLDQSTDNNYDLW